MEFQQASIYGKNYGSSLQVTSDFSQEISTTGKAINLSSSFFIF
jgi:phospholipid-transporting ATPase